MAIKKIGRLIFSDLSPEQRTPEEERLLRVYRALQDMNRDGDYCIYDAIKVLFRIEGFYEDEVNLNLPEVRVTIKRKSLDTVKMDGGTHDGGQYSRVNIMQIDNVKLPWKHS